MGTLKFYTKIYFMIISQYIKARMQYRTDFIISSIGMLLTNIAGLFSFWLIFKSISSLEGWNYYELVFIYAFSLLTLIPLQLCFDNIWNLRSHLVQGTFIKFYFKPVNMLFYYVSEVFDIKGLSQLVFGVGAFVYASIKIGLVWTPAKLLILIFVWLSSSLIMISIMLMAASTGFWIMNSSSLMIFAFRFREYARYPTDIFNSFFKMLFTYILPIGYIAFYPAQIFLRPGYINGVSVYLSPVIGIVFFSLAYFVWNKGVNNYSGTGS